MRAFAAGQRRRKSQTSARDALVLKARVIVLAEVLPISPRCIHLKGQSALRRKAAPVAHGRAVQSVSNRVKFSS